MSIKLLAIDIDDTLINSKMQMTPRVAAAVRAACEAGVAVVIATGRGYQGQLKFHRELGLDTPSICFAGAEIRAAGGELVFADHINGAAAIAAARELGQYVQVYADGCFVCEAETKYSRMYTERFGMSARIDPEYMRAQTVMTPKVLMITEPELAERIKPRVIEMLPQYRILQSKPYFIEAHNPAASKGTALAALAKKMGIKQSETAALGDSPIDISMIKWAALGIAMGNAYPEVAAAADAQTASCDEDGAALAIESLILGG